MVAGLLWWAAEASYRGDGQAGQEREEDGGGGMEKMQRGGIQRRVVVEKNAWIVGSARRVQGLRLCAGEGGAGGGVVSWW